MLNDYILEGMGLRRREEQTGVIKRASLQSQMLFVWFCQVALCVLLIRNLFVTDQLRIDFPASNDIVIAKFISALVLHWICIPEARTALDCMKFVVNHSHRFEAPFAAYLCMFLKLVSITAIEMLNMFSLLSVPDLFEFIRDFTALIVIADFEQLLSFAIKEDCIKLLNSNENFKNTCLLISRTTSDRQSDLKYQDLLDDWQEGWIEKPTG